MNRLLSTVATGVFVAAVLAGCSGSSPHSQTVSSSGPTSVRGKRVVYVWPDREPVYTAVGCGAKAVARTVGIDFSVSQPPDEFSPTKQIPVLNAVIASRPDAILISASDAKALVAPLKQAAHQGIKIITVSNNVDDTSFLTSAVIGDNVAAGRKAADLLARLAGDRKGPVAYIAYQRGGSTITDDRQDGFEAEIKKYPNLHYVGPALSSVNETDGARVANAIFSAHPDLVGIVGSFLDSSTGMAATIRERGLSKKVIGLQLDADSAGINNIRNGSLRGLEAERFRDEGAEAIRQLVDSYEGKPVTKTVTLPPVEFTSANVNDPDLSGLVPTLSC